MLQVVPRRWGDLEVVVGGVKAGETRSNDNKLPVSRAPPDPKVSKLAGTRATEMASPSSFDATKFMVNRKAFMSGTSNRERNGGLIP